MILRTDTDVPILDIQTETDVTSILNSYAARQPDTEHFQLWEVAGTAHADLHLIGAALGKLLNCRVEVNNGAMHVVAKAALHAFDTWLRTGTAPPHAPRLATNGTGAAIDVQRNADGIAIGGIRTPPVDVPVDVLSGSPGTNPSVICLLFGSTRPLTAARIAQLYPSRAVYEQRYAAATDATIKAGFALEADRAALMAYTQPSRVKP